MRLLTILCLLAAGCATTSKSVTATPELIYTPDERMIMRIQDRCYLVVKIDYAGVETGGDDFAFGQLVKVACPVVGR